LNATQKRRGCEARVSGILFVGCRKIICREVVYEHVGMHEGDGDV